mgnify:CR=1 FL=1
MAKCKAKIKNHTLLVKARLSFGEKWREKELDIFTRKYIRGLLKVKAARKGCIEYTGPIGISLEERLNQQARFLLYYGTDCGCNTKAGSEQNECE